MSGASLLNTGVPAIARDQHASEVTTQPATPLLPVPNRDQLRGLPQIALHQLPWAIDRPLKRPRPQKPRADLPDIVVKDRLAAGIPKLGGHLAQPLRLHPRLGRQLLADPVLKQIQL